MEAPVILHILLSAFLLNGISSAGNLGKEFTTAIMQNYMANYGTPQFVIFITTYQPDTKISVIVYKSTFKQDYTVRTPQTLSVKLPANVEMSGSAKFCSTILINAEKDVSVMSLNYKQLSADTMVVLPTKNLGTEYYVVTPLNGPSDSFKEFAIINQDAKENSIDIYPTGTLKLQDKTYAAGSRLTTSLNAYEALQLQSTSSLTGTRVMAQRPVAVISGHTCSWENSKCNHVCEQLFPVTSWGRSHILPKLPYQSNSNMAFITASQKCRIQVQSVSKSYSKDLDSGEVFSILSPDALYITSDGPIQVMFYCTGGRVDLGRQFYDPFLMNIPAIDDYCTSYTIIGQNEFNNYGIIVAKTSATSTLTFNEKTLGTIKWTPVLGSDYSYSSISYGTGTSFNSMENPSSAFGLFSVGYQDMNGYGAPAVCASGGAVVDPCKNAQCRKKEKCQVTGGEAVCIPESEVTCWAWGDPHFKSFDGKTYDFQGTCTYTIAKTCGSDSTLPFFSIEAKNENRGNTKVSYVAIVKVQVYGTNITVVKAEYGKVRVDNNLERLPITLQDGKVKIYQSGLSVIIEVYNKLKVSYDWNYYLLVTLPSSYYENVCGMCGNYNGNSMDDFTTPSGTLVSNAIDFGKSWKVNDGDKFCWDNCNGECKTCDANLVQKYKSDQYCGLLSNTATGPFRNCHAVIEPKIYLDNCVYDVCMQDGYKVILCQALKTYADACQSKGVSLYEWRETAGCPLTCPINSKYSLCGTSCPATCDDDTAPSKCKTPCVETCQCNDGFVLIDGKCMPKGNCGCTYRGRPYAPGEKFWGDDKCEQSCICNPLTRNADCKATKCKSTETCSVVNGIRNCYPVGYGTCSASGDPHYVTLDGLKYDFQGTCVYQFVSLCVKDDSLVNFTVNVQNNYRGSKVVSYTKLVEVFIYDIYVVMSTDYPDKIMVDNVLTNLPYSLQSNNLHIYKSGYDAILQTGSGIRVTFNWQSRVSVTIPTTYSGAVCGLCGNFNKNPKDDLTMKNGKLAANAGEFGQSWKTNEIPGCSHGCKGSCPDCAVNEKKQYEKESSCGLILKKDGPFRECHDVIEPNQYFQDCVYDVCLYKGRESILCQAITAYVSACQDAGAAIYPWRKDTFCSPSCGKNSHYEVCPSGCPTTCSSLLQTVICSTPCKEGCQCNEGFVLSGDACVPFSECGCSYNGKYYKSGETFYPNSLCQEVCKCNSNAQVECTKFSCSASEECKVVDGVQKCQPIGSGTCSASGDPHYFSFDNLAFDFQGTCRYVMAKSCTDDKNLEAFSVEVENESWGNGKVSVTKMVSVKVYDQTFTLLQKKNGLIKVNDINYNLPLKFNNTRVIVQQYGNNIIMETDFGIKVTYDLVYYATVTVPGNYKNKMCGLCGNYNGDKKDDFMLPNSKTTTDVIAFGASWKVSVPGTKCDDGCSGNNCPTCSADKMAVFKNDDYCGILTAPEGPFSACYTAIDPKIYFNNCVYDLCASNGDTKVLCNSIQAYVSACQEAKITIREWRTDSFCPLSCMANSHYKLCADICSSACAGITDPLKCPTHCVEGCECDDGYFFDGQECVTIDQCGCYENGRYYKNNEVVLSADCKEKCFCSPAGGFMCGPTDCQNDEKCDIVDGTVMCRSKDPCKKFPCREKETCKLIKDQPVCVPDFTVSCWAWGDPHYHSFDGYSFDFQGTCTYTIAKTCGNDTSLPQFEIIEKNDNRGNTAVSYVRQVTIHVYEYTISILKLEYGKVRVNDVVTNLPVTLADGKLRLTQSGGNAVVDTDFGLRVTYEWNWYLYITLTSSYYKNVCGLCGNFNGNVNDERMTPDGKLAPTVVEWAKSWKVKDRDKFCFDVCQGVCPTCDDTKRALYESEQYCGLLTKKTGAFKECHSKVNPDDFFDNCVYDVCLNNGAKQLLCQALNSYAATCRKNGVVIYDWRKQAGCPMDCGPNSQYEACGNACPASCSDRTAPSTCKEPCVETCTCDSGYVLSAGKCVAIDSCGCTHEGRYYNPNEEFWQDDNCRRLCRCNPKLGMVVCTDHECKSNEKCDIVNGVQNCYPISYSTCSASGDPHYETFDHLRFDFQGTCIYRLVGVSSKDPALTPFDIQVQNDNRGSKVVSFSKTAFISVYNTTVTISKDFSKKILVNGILTELPYYIDTNKVRIYQSGMFAMLEANFGLTFKFDWNSAMSVTLPSTYAKAVTGLCGNYNQNPKDDFTMPDGVLATTAVNFGNSWKVEDVPGCTPECTGTCPVCNEAQKQKYKTDKFCGIILSKTGPFRECLAVIDPKPYSENCAYDACQYNGHPSSYCDAISTYVAACQSAGLPVYQWRTDSFCKYNCPRYSHYELCGPGCPATCKGLSAPEGCIASCSEGCQCDNGYILSGDRCVPIASCGCTYNDQYYQNGAEFYPNGLCKEKCNCNKDGGVTCLKSACGANEECKVVNGVQGCHPVGEGKCVASGDPHYKSFDNLAFDFQGTCTYIMAKYTGSDKTLTPFAVLVENESYGSGNVAVTRMVVVDVNQIRITITQGMKWKVKVNEEIFNLPVSLADGNLWANQEGNNIVVRTKFGLTVLYDAVYYVSVTVPSNYKRQMGGLCGNFNDDRTDDYILPDGNKTKDVNTFGRSWKIKIPGAKCNDGCINCPSCDQTKTALYSKEDKCGIISSTKGPFSSCLPVVSPEIYLQNCIFDVCATDGNQDTFCKSLQAYAAACQAAGAEIKDWRSISRCPLTCPANSHYERCTRTCDHCCAGITDDLSCTDNCFEGCECNAGFVSQGEECVSMDNCGCFYEGRYYKPGETLVYPDCSQSCTCYATGGVICEDTSCAEDQDCLVKNGKRGCFQRGGTCSVKMGGQLLSFDDMSGKLPSNGVYEIASVCDEESSVWFRVVADFQTCNKQKTLSAATVFVFFDNLFIAMNVDKQTWVNGRPVQLPAKAGKDTSVTSLENMTVIKHSSGLELSISTTGEIRVIVGDDLQNRLCGACGNFNDDKNDDMKLPDGKITVNINEFLKAWKAKDLSYCDS